MSLCLCRTRCLAGRGRVGGGGDHAGAAGSEALGEAATCTEPWQWPLQPPPSHWLPVPPKAQLHYPTSPPPPLASGGARFIGASIGRLVAVKFLAQMNPSADVLAMASLEIDISNLKPGNAMIVKWRGKPVFVRSRTGAPMLASLASCSIGPTLLLTGTLVPARVARSRLASSGQEGRRTRRPAPPAPAWLPHASSPHACLA